jgi:hypothetical protein
VPRSPAAGPGFFQPQDYGIRSRLSGVRPLPGDTDRGRSSGAAWHA